MFFRSFFKNLFKPRSKFLSKNKTHLMLAGINQKIFLSHWGKPDLLISLDRLEGFYSFNQISIQNEISQGDQYLVWIYEKRDRIIIFKKGSLISHFKLSQFRNRLRNILLEKNSKSTQASGSFFLFPQNACSLSELFNQKIKMIDVGKVFHKCYKVIRFIKREAIRCRSFIG